MVIRHAHPRQAALLVLLAVVTVLVAACGSTATPTPTATPPPVATPTPAVAAPPATGTAQAVQQLYEDAKKEGRLVATGFGDQEWKFHSEGFAKKYPGIKLELVSVIGPAAAGKIVAEKQAGQPSSDVHIFSFQTTLVLQRNNLIDDSTDWDKYGLPPGRFSPGINTVTYTHFPCCQFAYNTKFLKKEDMPKGLGDLLDPLQQPKWRNKIASTPFIYSSIWGQWYHLTLPPGLPPAEAEAKTLQNAQRVQKELGILITDNPRPLFLNGERPIHWASSGRVVIDREEGGPDEWVHFPEFRGIVSWVASIIKGTPHINAARLFTLYIASPEGVANARKANGNAYMGLGWDRNDPTIQLSIARGMSMDNYEYFIESPENQRVSAPIATKVRNLITQ